MENLLGGFKYLLAVFMMFAGVVTMFAHITPVEAPLGFLYSTRISLVIFGIIFFVSGATLLIGKIRKSRKWTGRGLLYIYYCFLFASIINGISSYGAVAEWLPNAILALITGALWLRWKLKTEYVNPKHFVDERRVLTRDR